MTAVLVDSLHNTSRGYHVVSMETLSIMKRAQDYVQIVDIKTMELQKGPHLPVAGGACISKALPTIPNEPPMICTFAGTQGHHDCGTFLPFTLL